MTLKPAVMATTITNSANARDAEIVCGLALQNGVSFETIRRAPLRDAQGRASTPIGTATDLVIAGETAAAVIVPHASVCAPRDRAGVVATSILLIVATALRGWMAGDDISVADVRAEIAGLLRDEFSDIQHRTLCEIRREDE